SDYLDINKRNKRLEEIMIGLINNEAVLFSPDDIQPLLKVPNRDVRAALASREGVEELLSIDDIKSLINDPDPLVRTNAASNTGILLRFVSS
ncbi:MAG: hypothetical protein QXD23_03090, partial [Candidatus Micrarchaeaceae archaeon]